MFATSRRVASTEDAWILTLRAVTDSGIAVPGVTPSLELLGFDVVVDQPRRRIIANAARPMPIIAGVARFVWMMAGNDRLEDIAFYEPNVRRFTDDDLAVPGSNYGARLRRSYAGTDQVRDSVERLRGSDGRSDGALRRTANVIWRPEDAGRDSSDIPCAFGVFYSPRDGQLITQLMMRSNNAVALLPWNMFEFSLLGEVVATEARLELGPMRVDAASMHTFEHDAQRIGDILDAADGSTGPEMPPMPSAPAPLEQISLVARAEARLRHDLVALADESVDEMRARGQGLDPYWQAFFEVLLVHAAHKVDRPDAADRLATELPDYFASGARAHLAKMRDQEPTLAAGDRLFVLPGAASEERAAEERQMTRSVRDALRGDDTRRRDEAHIHSLLDKIEAEGTVLSRKQGQAVVDKLLDERTAAFARSEKEGSARDVAHISIDEVRAAIRDLGYGQ